MNDPNIAKILAEFRRQLDEADDPPAPPVPAPVRKASASFEQKIARPRGRPSLRSSARPRSDRS